MRSWQTIITAAGEDNASFQSGGIHLPKNLIPFRSTTILGAAIDSYASGGQKTHVVIRRDEADVWETHKVFQANFPDIDFHLIPRATRGALCSAAMTLDTLEPDVPIIITSGDSIISGVIAALLLNFIEDDSAAGTILFESSLSRWSYARLGNERQILEMAEKSPISKFASTGLFYFKSPELFMRAAEWVLKENMHTKGEFYLSSALNYLIMNGERVLGVELPSGYDYLPLSTLSDLKSAEEATHASL